MILRLLINTRIHYRTLTLSQKGTSDYGIKQLLKPKYILT